MRPIAALVALALALVALAAAPLGAETWYVDPATGSTEGDGSAADPWSTLEAVVAAGKITSTAPGGGTVNPGAPVGPGDTILLRSGYHGDVSISGYLNADTITVAAADGHTPGLRRLRLTDVKNWTFDRLTISPQLAPSFSRLQQVSIGGASSYVTLRNCHCYSVDDVSGYSATQWLNNTANGIGVGSSSHHVSLIDNTVRNTDHGIALSGTDLLVRGNRVINFRGDGMRALNHNQTIEFNTIKNSYNVDDNHDDGIQCYKTGTVSGDVLDMVVRGNLIVNAEDPDQPLRGALQGMGFFDGQHINFRVENNLVITDHWHGITILGAEGCAVINNTVVNPWWLSGESGLRTWIQIGANKDGTPATGNTIRNNITHYLNTGGNVDLALDHNLTVDAASAADVFADWQARDFHLAADSPAIDAGSSVDAPATDVEGNARPAGAAWDIGAYEFGAEPGPPVAHAGEDQAAGDPDGDGLATVTLDGSASYDPDGSIVSWTWTEGTQTLATGEVADVTLAYGEHTITLTVANDDDPPENATDTVTVTVAETAPVDSSLAWQNFAYPLQSEPFAVEFDARPNAAGVDALLGLCRGDADGYDDLACIVRFYVDGQIDVRNGDAYAADLALDYTPGTWYHVRMVVDPAAHTYSVTVTPDGGSPVALATDYAFRDAQAALGEFDRWAIVHTGADGMTVDHVAVGPPEPGPVIDSWATAAEHGTAGMIVAPLTDGATESRAAGFAELRIAFDADLDPATAVAGALALAGEAGGDRSALIQSLAVAADGKTLVATFAEPLPDDRYTAAVTDTLGDLAGNPVAGDADLAFSVLAGDVDGSGVVTAADVLAVRDAAGAAVDATTAHLDVDASGALTGADALAVHRRHGNALP